MAKVIEYKMFSVGENVLVRKYDKYFGHDLVLNDVCTIVRYTEKAVLFKISEEWEHEDNPNRGKSFWVAKSVLYMLEGELKVVYLKQWAEINLV